MQEPSMTLREPTTDATDKSGVRPLRTDGRALKILAKSVYRELKSSGHSRSDIVGFTNALLELVTTDLKQQD